MKYLKMCRKTGVENNQSDEWSDNYLNYGNVFATDDFEWEEMILSAPVLNESISVAVQSKSSVITHYIITNVISSARNTSKKYCVVLNKQKWCIVICLNQNESHNQRWITWLNSELYDSASIIRIKMNYVIQNETCGSKMNYITH